MGRIWNGIKRGVLGVLKAATGIGPIADIVRPIAYHIPKGGLALQIADGVKDALERSIQK